MSIKEFSNVYEPDNLLQSVWDMTNTGGCLCTMRETCSWCDSSAYESRKKISKKILQQAKDTKYQIYLNRGRDKVDFDYVTKTYDLN